MGTNIKATVTAGAETANIKLLLESDPALRIEDLKTSLEVTWFRPTRNVWLGFRTVRAADRPRKLVDATPIRGFQLCGVIRTEPGKVTLQISNIPECISDEQLKTQFGRHSMSLVSGKLSYETSNRKSTQAIRDAIAEITAQRVSSFTELSGRDKSLRLKAEIVFDGSARLDGYARQLEGWRLEGFGNTKIFAVERVVVRLRLRHSLYEQHVRKLKSTASEIWKHDKVQVSIDDTAKEPSNNAAGPREVELVLRSTNRAALVSAKAKLDRIFRWNMSGHVTGASRPSRQTHRIRLTKTRDYKKVLATITEAQKEFGADAIKLDEESDPPAVVVHGDTKTLRKVQDYFSLHTNREKPQCAICEEKTDDVVRTRGCNHIACQDCFLAYCTTDIESKLPLQCFASECGVLLPIDQLHSQLPKADLTRIIDQAVHGHLKQNVDTFGQCPGIDCHARFPVATVSEQHICPSCFTVGCPRCKVEFHYGETCESYASRIEREGVVGLRSWMESKKAKQCPSCKCLVEKDDGCNNMTCSCGVHFCWVCLHVESSHEMVYGHLRKEHGSYWDTPEEEDRILDEFRAEDEAARRLELVNVRQHLNDAGGLQPNEAMRLLRAQRIEGLVGGAIGAWRVRV